MRPVEDFKWAWCGQCECMMVICPTCGNNCCNGTYGPLATGKHDCPDCPQAYDVQEAGHVTEPPSKGTSE